MKACNNCGLFYFGDKQHCYYDALLASHSCTFCFLLNNEENVEVSDTTKLNSSTKACLQT